MMSDGRFHSGETLGGALGVSRAAVWKSLSRLEREGFPIQRVRGKGYRIPKGAVLLDLDQIKRHFQADVAAYWQWHLYQDIDSTNAQAQRLLVESGGRRPLVCISERQASGRGRRGRTWVSPYGQNIYMTLVEPFADGAQGLEGLSLIVGIVLADALESCGYPQIRLKWPNDLLLESKKLAGILIEVAGDLTSDCVAVIGVGVNVLMRPEAGAEIDQAWTSLLQAAGAGELDRNKLVAAFAEKLLMAMERFRCSGFQDFIVEWNKRDAWLGLSVSIVSGSNALHGVHQGVNERGALKLLTAEGLMLINGGEVSLRVNNAS
tara:strand:+ start:1449 stop:2408 length:960 start_codon:yes stop_codon:yes gene_type:complete